MSAAAPAGDLPLGDLLRSLRVGVGDDAENAAASTTSDSTGTPAPRPPSLPLTDQLSLLSAHIDTIRGQVAATASSQRGQDLIASHARRTQDIHGRLATLDSKLGSFESGDHDAEETQARHQRESVAAGLKLFNQARDEVLQERQTGRLARVLYAAVASVEALEALLSPEHIDLTAISNAVAEVDIACAPLGLNSSSPSEAGNALAWIGASGSMLPQAISQLAARIESAREAIDELVESAWQHAISVQAASEDEASLRIADTIATTSALGVKEVTMSQLIDALSARSGFTSLAEKLAKDMLQNLARPLLTSDKKVWSLVDKGDDKTWACQARRQATNESDDHSISVATLLSLLPFVQSRLFSRLEPSSTSALQQSFLRFFVPAFVKELLSCLKFMLPSELELHQSTLASAKQHLSSLEHLARQSLDTMAEAGFLRHGLDAEAEDLRSFSAQIGRHYVRNLANLARAQCRDILSKEQMGGWESVAIEIDVEIPATQAAQALAQANAVEDHEVEELLKSENTAPAISIQAPEMQVTDDAWAAWGEEDDDPSYQDAAAATKRVQPTSKLRHSQRMASDTSNGSATAKRPKSSKLGGVRVVKPQAELGSGPFPAQDGGDDAWDEWGFDDEQVTPGDALASLAQPARVTAPPVDDDADAWFEDEPVAMPVSLQLPRHRQLRSTQEVSEAATSSDAPQLADFSPSVLTKTEEQENVKDVKVDDDAWGLDEDEEAMASVDPALTQETLSLSEGANALSPTRSGSSVQVAPRTEPEQSGDSEAERRNELIEGSASLQGSQAELSRSSTDQEQVDSSQSSAKATALSIADAAQLFADSSASAPSLHLESTQSSASARQSQQDALDRRISQLFPAGASQDDGLGSAASTKEDDQERKEAPPEKSSSPRSTSTSSRDALKAKRRPLPRRVIPARPVTPDDDDDDEAWGWSGPADDPLEEVSKAESVSREHQPQTGTFATDEYNINPSPAPYEEFQSQESAKPNLMKVDDEVNADLPRIDNFTERSQATTSHANAFSVEDNAPKSSLAFGDAADAWDLSPIEEATGGLVPLAVGDEAYGKDLLETGTGDLPLVEELTPLEAIASATTRDASEDAKDRKSTAEQQDSLSRIDEVSTIDYADPTRDRAARVHRANETNVVSEIEGQAEHAEKTAGKKLDAALSTDAQDVFRETEAAADPESEIKTSLFPQESQTSISAETEDDVDWGWPSMAEKSNAAPPSALDAAIEASALSTTGEEKEQKVEEVDPWDVEAQTPLAQDGDNSKPALEDEGGLPQAPNDTASLVTTAVAGTQESGSGDALDDAWNLPEEQADNHDVLSGSDGAGTGDSGEKSISSAEKLSDNPTEQWDDMTTSGRSSFQQSRTSPDGRTPSTSVIRETDSDADSAALQAAAEMNTAQGAARIGSVPRPPTPKIGTVGDRGSDDTLMAESLPISADDDEEDAWGWAEETEAESFAPSQGLEPVVGVGDSYTSSQQQLQTPKVTENKTRETAGSHSLLPTPSVPEKASPTRQTKQKESCLISQRSVAFVGLVKTIVQDLRIVSEEQASTTPIKIEAKQLVEALRDVLDLHQALMPVSHAETLRNVPTLAAQFVNDCAYVSRELQKLEPEWSEVEQRLSDSSSVGKLSLGEYSAAVNLLGQRSFDAQILIQQHALAECLAETQGFEATFEDERFHACQRAMQQVITIVKQLGRAWKGVLGTSRYVAAMGRVTDGLLRRVLRDVTQLEDISEVEGNRLAELLRSLTELEDLFRANDAQAVDADGQATSDVALHVPSWFKVSYLCDILTGSLVDIEFLYFEAGALVDFSKPELVRLIRALFSDSPKRAGLIARIQQGA